jgi:hypothetical protein
MTEKGPNNVRKKFEKGSKKLALAQVEVAASTPLSTAFSKWPLPGRKVSYGGKGQTFEKRPIIFFPSKIALISLPTTDGFAGGFKKHTLN